MLVHTNVNVLQSTFGTVSTSPALGQTWCKPALGQHQSEAGRLLSGWQSGMRSKQEDRLKLGKQWGRGTEWVRDGCTFPWPGTPLHHMADSQPRAPGASDWCIGPSSCLNWTLCQCLFLTTTKCFMAVLQQQFPWQHVQDSAAED